MASVTTWTRLEPHPREGSLQRSLQAQVRDPLWFLARQWQVGEFQGEDAGSPVQATMSVTSRPLTGYAPDGGGVAATAYDPVLPLETHIERVPVTLNVRGSAQLGRWAETAIRAAVAAAEADTVIAALRAAYPIAPTAAPDAAEDPRGRAVRAGLAGRVVDGAALAAAYATVQAGGTPNPPLPPAAADAGIPAVLAALVAYRAALYSEPDGDDAWRPRRLDYAATVTSSIDDPADGTTPETLALVATDFPGGELDWYSFSLADPAPAQPASPAPGASSVETFNFLPQHVRYRGMPSPHWWEFEDSVTDFGALKPDRTDLATLLLAEFALVYGNDWFVVPVPTGVGTLGRPVVDVRPRRLALPADAADQPGPDRRRPAGGHPVPARRHGRDGLGGRAPGPGTAGRAGRRPAARPRPRHRARPAPAAGPDARRPETDLRAGNGRGDVTPSAQLLDPGRPMFVADERIPREGTEVTRYFRRVRAQDGSTVTWLAHHSRPGRGPGWSGLAFDLVRPLPPAPSA
jgi:hypothetical protein